MKLVHLIVLPGATGEFRKSRKSLKNATFLKMRKNLPYFLLSKISFFFGVFQVRHTSL